VCVKKAHWKTRDLNSACCKSHIDYIYIFLFSSFLFPHCHPNSNDKISLRQTLEKKTQHGKKENNRDGYGKTYIRLQGGVEDLAIRVHDAESVNWLHLLTDLEDLREMAVESTGEMDLDSVLLLVRVQRHGRGRESLQWYKEKITSSVKWSASFQERRKRQFKGGEGERGWGAMAMAMADLGGGGESGGEGLGGDCPGQGSGGDSCVHGEGWLF